MNFPEPECNWECNRIHGKWCEAHIKRIDFQVYIITKKTIFSHYRQIIMHEQSKEFHPGSVEGINQMINDSKEFIKILKSQINEFQKKYKEGWNSLPSS